MVEFLLWATLIAALVIWRWEVLLLFPLGILLLSVLFGALFPLRPIDLADVKRARTRANAEGVVVLIVIVGVVWFFGRS